MTRILKRLEIIKSSIAIEELEIIEQQTAKLQTLGIDEDVRIIIQNLEDGAYSTAETLIQNYLTKFSGIAIYEDSELLSLKLELKSLESKLQNLIEQKTEYLNDIEEFNNEYNLHLGELIRAILALKKEILYKQVQQKEKYKENLQTFEETKEIIEELKNIIAELEEALENIDEDDENYEELTKAYKALQEEREKLETELENQKEELEKTKEFIEDETIEEEYEEAKTNYDEYENNYEQTKENQKDVMQLSEDEKMELKQLFKKAARLCHPDVVSDEFKEKATQMMQQLNDAYSKKDLKRVKAILSSLENGTIFEATSDKLEDKIKLQEKIKEYKQNIKDIEDEIALIMEDDAYQIISGLDDWDEYFEKLKSDLEAQKEELEKEAKTVLDVEENITTSYIQSIDVPNFEKIRRYCNNLVNENKADEMQKYLAENGKMHKALIYDALEQFILQLNGKNLTLVEWGCGQGIASMLVLDYIREKQLDIEVLNVILIEDDTKALSRAMEHNQVFISQSVEISGFDGKDKRVSTKLKNIKGSNILHIFANDTMPMKFKDVGFESIPNSYFMCISSVNSVFLEKVHSEISALSKIKTLSSRDGKIGKFQRYERIFTL